VERRRQGARPGILTTQLWPDRFSPAEMFLAAQSVFAVINKQRCTSTSACRLDVARCAGTFPILSSAGLDSFSALNSLSLAAGSSGGPRLRGGSRRLLLDGSDPLCQGWRSE
jgi:hypothetical protein